MSKPTTATRLLRHLMPRSPRHILEHVTMTETEVEYIVAAERGETTALVDVVADIGNARSVVLVSDPQTGTTIERIMPSARTLLGASSREVFSARGLPPKSWHALKADEHVISRNGVEIFVGTLAVESDLPASGGRGSDRRYSDGTTLDLLLSGICSALPRVSKISVRVSTLVPIALFDALEATIITSLKKTHTITYNGHDVQIKVTEVVVRREGQAAYAALAGEKSGRTLIVDGGGRTINLALFDNGVYKLGRTLDNVGVEAALDALDKSLLDDRLRPLSLRERIELLDALKAGQSYAIVAHNARVDITAKARAYMDATASAAAAEMYAKVRVEAAQFVHVIGGAAYDTFFGAIWQQELPNPQLAKDPEKQNAYGALLDMNANAKRPRARR